MKKRELILFDSIGATITSLLYGAVVPLYFEGFHLAYLPLRMLSIIAIGYAVYGLYSYWLRPDKGLVPLYVLAILNVVYALVLAAIVILNVNEISNLGLVVMLGEFFIILLLAQWEWRSAKSG